MSQEKLKAMLMHNFGVQTNLLWEIIMEVANGLKRYQLSQDFLQNFMHVSTGWYSRHVYVGKTFR